MNTLLRTGCSAGLGLFLVAGLPADDRDALKGFAEKALKAAGGENVQLRAWSLSYKSTMKVWDREDPGQSGVVRVYIQLPDLYRSEFESKSFVDDKRVKTIVVVNGQKGWRHLNVTSETEDLTAEEVAAYQETIQTPVGIRGAALLHDPSYKLHSLPDTKIDDRAAVGVRLKHDKRRPIRLYFDKETALLLKSERTQDDDDRLERSWQITYSDFRRVGTILVPHKRVYKAEGPSRGAIQVEGVGTIKTKANLSPVHCVDELTELEFADKLDPKLFEKP
jgi:hypothetical protein